MLQLCAFFAFLPKMTADGTRSGKSCLAALLLHVTLFGNPEFQDPMPLPRSFSCIAAVLRAHNCHFCRATRIGPSPTRRRSSVSSTLAEAFALYQGGKFASAAEKYRLVLATDEKNSDAYAGRLAESSRPTR